MSADVNVFYYNCTAFLNFPVEYLGNQSGSLGGVVSYDLIHTGAINIQAADVIIEGGGIRLVWQSAPFLAPTNTWQHVSLTLSPSPQWHVEATDGIAATNADFAAVLSSVTRFYIRGEYTDGADNTGIDNVSLQRASQSQPVPASIYTAVEIVWSTISGKTYQVQSTLSLDSPNWADFGQPVVGDGAQHSAFDKTRDVTTRFYRVIEVQ